MTEIHFKLNGEPAHAKVHPGLSVLTLLRETFDLAGTKPGCEEGECGACTILLDGQAVNACLVPAAVLDRREVLTIEGLAATDGSLHPVQRAFVEAGAIQCGFCTPGMIMRTVAFLEERPDPTPDEIARSLEGNLCRCTGYVKIQQAIRCAAETLSADTSRREP